MSEQTRDQGLQLLRAGDVGGAMRLLRQTVEESPTDVLACSYLGVCQLRGGLTAEALDTLRHSVELDPHNATARYNYARALQQENQSAEASIELDELLKEHPDHASGQALLRHIRADAAPSVAQGGLILPPPQPAATRTHQAPGAGRRILRGLLWGAMCGQWWTLWTMFSLLLWGEASTIGTAGTVIAAVVFLVAFGCWGALTGLVISLVSAASGATVGVVSGLICCALEWVYLGGSPINLLFYYVTGRWVGDNIARHVHAPIAQ